MRLIFNIFGCATIDKYKQEILKINETWGKTAEELGVKILFFLGEEKTDLIDDSKYIYLNNINNTYSSIGHKQYLGLKYIHDNYDADFIFICGTDTYPNIKKLLLYLTQFDSNEKLYIGGDDGYRDIGISNIRYHTGGGFLISKGILNELYPSLDNLQNEWNNICKINRCDYLIDACDVSIAFFISKCNNVKLIDKENSFYGCNYKGFANNNTLECCSKKININEILSCHHMTLSDFDEYTFILIQNNYFINNMEYTKKKYSELCNTYNDIYEHLPTLYKYATECESIIELGVRGCVSSWALLNGLLNNNKPKKYLFLNDISECDINELLNNTNDLGVDIKYEWKNDLELDIKTNVDLTFIDTWHIYGQLKRELDKFSKVTNKYIIMHDTTVDEIEGETIRNGWNAEEQSKTSGYPIEEIKCGLWKAVNEFLKNNNEWVLKERFTNNNGLTVLEKLI